MRKVSVLAALALFSALAVGCGDVPTSPSQHSAGAPAQAAAPQPDVIGEQDD
jgi:hypothetical protein